jgi:hypothetical protein
MNGRPIEFELTREDKKEYTNFSGKAIGSFHETTKLNVLFFDKINIDALQHGIRYGVHKKTCGKHLIGNQDTKHLLIIMRSIYLQYSLNLEVELLEQIRYLNSKVLDFTINKIVGEINMYSKYLEDIDKISFRATNPINTNNVGTKNY